METAATNLDSQWKLGIRNAFILVALCINSIIVSLDATIVVTSLASIAEVLQGSTLESFWVGTSYLLTFAVIQPLVSSLSEIIGQKWALLLSLFFFTAGSIVCCTAMHFPQLLAGRAIQGIGGGGITVMSNVLLTYLVPLQYRPRYVGYIQAFWFLGMVTGPIIGGLFATPRLWRWIFYINFPFIGVALCMIPITMKGFQERENRRLWSSVDWIGASLFAAGVTTVLVGLTTGGHTYPWRDWHVAVLLAIGLVVLLAMYLWQRYMTAKRFIHTELFARKSAVLTYVIAIAQGIQLYGQMYYLALYLEGVKFLSPVKTGVTMLTIFLGLMPTSVGCGRLITRTGKYRWAIWSGCLFNVLSTGLLLLLNERSGKKLYIPLLVFVGLSQGILFSALQFAAQATVAPENQGRSAALYTFMRSVGMCLGVALGGVVFENVLDNKFRDSDIDSRLAQNITALIAKKRLSESGLNPLFVRRSISDSLHGVYELLTSIAAAALILSSFIRHYDLLRLPSEK